MSILVDEKTRLITQGITGREGMFHTEQSMKYGTKVVGGVTPGKGGQTVMGKVPVFNTVADAVKKTKANATMVFVPPPFAADAILEAADAGLKYLLDRSVGNEEILAVAEGSADAKLGTASLLAISLIKRRAATGDKQYDQTLEMLGNFIITMQREDGSMLYFWDQQTASPVPDITSLFATGEALWALASLHNLFPEKRWDHLAFRTLDYMATQRDEDENVWPRPWADQWAAYSLNEMSEWGLSEIHIQYARELAAQFGIAVRWESQRNGGLDGLVHSPEPIAAGQGTWIEAIGMLHQLSEDEPRLEDLRIPLQERLLCAAGRMRVKQTTGTGTVEFDGGWFTGGVSRVDGQQHALSGLLFAALSLDEQGQ